MTEAAVRRNDSGRRPGALLMRILRTNSAHGKAGAQSANSHHAPASGLSGVPEGAGEDFCDGALRRRGGGNGDYIADSLEEAERMAEKDPYVVEGVRRLEMHEWKRVR